MQREVRIHLFSRSDRHSLIPPGRIDCLGLFPDYIYVVGQKVQELLTNKCSRN